MAEDKPNPADKPHPADKPADQPAAHPHEHPLPARAETSAEIEKQPEVHHPDGRMEHPWIGFETRDARFSVIIVIMAVIACFAAAQFYVVLCFYRHQVKQQAEAKKSPYPLAPAPSAQAPLEPRLEQIDRLKGIARENVYRRELVKEAVLHSYGDTSDEGFVHIPIEQAMQLVAGKLKVRADQPAAPHHDRGLVDGGESNSGRLFRGAPRW